MYVLFRAWPLLASKTTARQTDTHTHKHFGIHDRCAIEIANSFGVSTPRGQRGWGIKHLLLSQRGRISALCRVSTVDSHGMLPCRCPELPAPTLSRGYRTKSSANATQRPHAEQTSGWGQEVWVQRREPRPCGLHRYAGVGVGIAKAGSLEIFEGVSKSDDPIFSRPSVALVLRARRRVPHPVPLAEGTEPDLERLPCGNVAYTRQCGESSPDALHATSTGECTTVNA